MGIDRTVTIFLAVFIAIIVVGAVAMGGLFGGAMGPGMMYGYGSSGATAVGGWAGGIAMGLGAIMMIAFWGLIVLGLVFLIRALTNRPTSGSEPEPLAILQRRYAAGEIDEPTYQRMRRELTSTENYPREVPRAG